MKIAVADAKRICLDRELDQVIIFGWDKKTGIFETATYGKTRSDCEQAAKGRDKILGMFGWIKRED